MCLFLLQISLCNSGACSARDLGLNVLDGLVGLTVAWLYIEPDNILSCTTSVVLVRISSRDW